MRAPCSSVPIRWEEIAGPIEVADVLDMAATMTLCRDDACGNCAPHAAHPVRSRRDRTEYNVHPLDEIVYAHVHERECRTAGQIYGLVLNDYGTVDYRTLQRALARLSQEHKIIAVLSRRRRRRLANPNDLGRRGGAASGGAYIRWTSPLLWTQDGLECLTAQVEDLIQDRSLCHGRNRSARLRSSP
jgi:hypothetical protein